MSQMTTNQALIKKAYTAFNNRDIETALAMMHEDVVWPSRMDGGTVDGREAVRDYWMQQWAEINTRVEPLAFKTNADKRVVVDVHQVVRDLDGNVLADYMVQHVYTMEDGLVRRMEIRKV